MAYGKLAAGSLSSSSLEAKISTMLLQHYMMYSDQDDIPNTLSASSLANLQYSSKLIINFN